MQCAAGNAVEGNFISAFQVQDDEEQAAILFRVTNVRVADDGVPLFEIRYMHTTRSTPDFAAHVRDAARIMTVKGQAALKVRAKLADQRVWMRVLEENTERLDPAYVARERRAESVK